MNVIYRSLIISRLEALKDCYLLRAWREDCLTELLLIFLGFFDM
jgi:hypothetical protein